MLRLTVALLAALSIAAAPSAAWAGWNQPSGGPLNVTTGMRAEGPAIASVDGVPYVAWTEPSAGHSQIFVKRLEGTTWVQVGGSLNVEPTHDAAFPDITSVDGVPFVAWLEANGSQAELYVKRLVGDKWVAAGSGPLNMSSTGDAAEPSIVSVAGVPYVAWDEQQPGGPSRVFVDRLIGSTWMTVGSGGLNVDLNADARSPRLAEVGGVPYAVWTEDQGHRWLIHVRAFDGAGFVPVGDDPLNISVSQSAIEPSIAAVDGVPYVAWSEPNRLFNQIYVKRLSARGSTTVGGSLNVDPAQAAGAPTIASIGGAPTVAWQEPNGSVYQVHVSRFDGTSWRAIGGPLNVDPSQDAFFIVDPTLVDVGGVPYVTWVERSGTTYDVRVKRLEPEILTESAIVSGSGVTLSADVNDFGLPLPVGFEYGAGVFTARTALQLSSGAGVSTITELLGGLSPGTRYVYRAFGSDTFRETTLGSTEAFSTPSLPGVIPGPDAPRITRLRLSPAVFLAGSRGASIATPRPGAVVSYVDSEPATTTFTVSRALTGRRAGGTCRALSRQYRRGKRCIRYVRVGSFTRTDTAGDNSFRFTGRVGGRTLLPGRYRLQAIARNRAGSSRPAYRSFEVKR